MLAANAMPALAMATSADGGASYCRYSSRNQDERTIADQQRQCRQRAARDGLIDLPLIEFADEAESGAKHSRRDFDRMMAAARAGQIRVLYVSNLSRLARDCVLTLQTMRELVYVHKVRVVSIDEGLDTAQSDTWELIAAILAVQHQQYLKKLALDVFRGLEGVVLDHYCVGDYCFGYGSEPVPGTEGKGRGQNRTPKTRYIVDLDEAGWVIKIFYWFVEERRSLRWIAQELNRLGAPKDHRATTALWYHQLLTRLLSNRKYVGQWPWGERQNVRDLEGNIRQEKRSAAETEKWLRHFPDLQIVPDEIFAKAQELLAENAAKCGSHRRADGKLRGSTRASQDVHPRHVLSGLIESECGRKRNVGGANGKYLFCRGYGMGACFCKTTLRRELAERLILDAIGQSILLNPQWVDLLWTHAVRSYARLQRELPSQRRALEDHLAELKKRIGNLVANSEMRLVPELDARMTELRSEREKLQAELKGMLAESEHQVGPPTREWIEVKLGDLRSTLTGSGPAAAHALRALVGGKIVVKEIRRPGKKRHYLRGRLELRLRAVAEAIGTKIDGDATDDEQPVDVIEIDFREPHRREQIADEVKRLWDEGVAEKEICEKLGCSRTLLSRALDFWYEKRGLIRPDGRSCKKRLKGLRMADRLQPQILDLFFEAVPIMKIAERLGCSPEVVREAVEKWHQERGLPVPDGRARRREIRLKRRAG